MKASQSSKTQAGINQAVASANTKVPTWADMAYQELLAYGSIVGGLFNSDMVRDWATRRGLPEPPSRRAWGGVFQRAAHAGDIEIAAIQNYNYPGRQRTHVTTNRFWRKV